MEICSFSSNINSDRYFVYMTATAEIQFRTSILLQNVVKPLLLHPMNFYSRFPHAAKTKELTV